MSEPSPSTSDWDDHRGSAFTGARWQVIGRGAYQVVRLVVNIALARLVAPADFGVMAIAISVAEILEVLKDMGTGRVVIQRDELPRRMYDSIFGLNLLIGLAVACGLGFGADFVAMIYGETNELPRVLQLLALTFFISSSAQVQVGLLTRKLAFGRLAAANLVGALTNGIVAISLGWMGWGVWALAIGHFASGLTLTVTVWILNPWRPRIRLYREDLRAISHFSLHLTGSNIFSLILGNTDTLIISRFLGTTLLGYYTIARSLVSPVRTIAQMITSVINPALARVQNDPVALHRDFLRSAAMTGFITSPLLVGIAVTARPFVEVALGEKWLPAVPVVQVFAAVTFLYLTIASALTLYFTKQRTDALLRWTIVSSSMLVPSWIIGAQYGVVEVMLGSLVTFGILFFPGIRSALRLIDLPFSTFISNLRPFLVAAALMGITCMGTRLLLESQGVIPLGVLVATVLVGGATYGAYMLWKKPAVLDDLGVFVGLRPNTTPGPNEPLADPHDSAPPVNP